MDTGWGLSGLREPDQSQGDALRVGALTRLKGFVSVLGEELRRDLDSGSPDSEGWQLRQASVESRQVQLQELRQMLNDVRETTPEEMRQIRQATASNVRDTEPVATADAVDGVVQELHDAIGRNVRLARREAVLEAYCEEQNKILRCVESSESRLKDCEAQESGKNEELKQAKLAAEREALEIKVSWRKDRMELHRVQMELQQAQQAVANLQEQLSEVAQKEEAQRGLLQSARVTDIQATVWQSKVANQAKDLERLKSRCAELDSEMILNRGQYQSLEAWAADAKQVESQQALQKKIFQERCVELQAKLDKSRVAYYEKGRELQVVRIQHEEERQQLQQQKDEALRGHQSLEKEKRMLQEKVTDLEVQNAESLLSSSYHASQHGQLRARVEDLSTGKSQELVQQLAELDAKYQDLEGRYAVANAARSGLAQKCGLLEEENARLEESLSKELRDKEDLLESHAESSVASAASASKLAERLRHFERQQQELETEAAEDRSRLRMELANAEAQHADMERLRERERLVEQLKMQYHLAQKLLVRFRGLHDALAWKDLMAEVDLTILSIAQAGAKGMGQGMVLTELVTHLHHLAESAQQQTQRHQIQLEAAESAADAAQQQQVAAELRQEELETQNLRLEAELAKTQMIQSTLQDSKPLALPDDLPEEYSAIIKEVVLNGWDSVEWGGNFTLLHWAAMQNRQHLCQSLLELRANPSLRDDTGMTAADYAREKGHQDVMATLQSVHLLKR